jgi:hypothetical protein
MENSNKSHLGDGVYVIYNGNYDIELAVNDHKNVVVVLDIDILQKLVEFVKIQQEKYGTV